MARRKGRSLTREQVVATALRIVQDEGADALGVSRVARELGIKPPSIYNHVGTGDALAKAVVIEGNRQLLAAYKDAVRGVVDAREELRVLARSTRTWVRDNGGLYTLMARVRPDNDHPQLGPIIRDMLDLFARPLRRLGVPAEETVHAIRAFRSAIHGFVLLETSAQFQLEQSPDDSYTWMVEALLPR